MNYTMLIFHHTYLTESKVIKEIIDKENGKGKSKELIAEVKWK